MSPQEASRRDEEISCRTRRYYATRSEAKRAWKELRRQPGRRHLEINDCRHCGGFHLGNPPGHQNHFRPGRPYSTGYDVA